MTEAEHKEAIRLCRNIFVEAANELAKLGQHPVCITEGAMCAALQMNEAAMGNPAVVAWLRDAADHIEAGLLEHMPTSVFGNPPPEDMF